MPSSTATLATFFVHQQPSHNSFARAPFMSPVAEMVSRLDCNIPSFSCHSPPPPPNRLEVQVENLKSPITVLLLLLGRIIFLRLDHPRQVVEIYVLLRTHLDNVAVFVQHHVERHPPETQHPLRLLLVLAIHEEVLQPVPSGGVVPVDDLAGAVARIAAYRRELYPLVPLVRG